MRGLRTYRSLGAISLGIEKRLGRFATSRTNGFDRRVVHFFQRRIPWMMGILVGIIVPRIVAADQSPSRLVAEVGIGTVKRVTMEEDGISRIHLAVHQLQPQLGSLDTFGIRSRLGTEPTMLDASHTVRTPQ